MLFVQGNCFSRSHTNAEPFASCEDPQELKKFSPMTVALFYTRKDERRSKAMQEQDPSANFVC